MKFIFVSLLALCAVALTTSERPIAVRPKPSTTTAKPLPKNKFSVISSNTIRRNKDFTIYVRALDVKSSTNIKIVLASDDGSYSIEKSVRLSASTSKYVGSFDTSSLPDAATSFTLTVTSDDYTESKPVTFVTKENSVFIQTNKGIFKPAEVVQYRVFSIDSESNAYDPKSPVTITLTDPRNNEMGKIENAFVNGKFQGEWQLPSKPILGTWKLTLKYSENEPPVLKTFVVNEYTLSMFTASLSVPSQVSYSSSQLPITINAEYTFKQPISGIATITITNNGATWTKNISCTEKSTTFFVNFVKDLGLTSAGYNYLTVALVFIDPKTNTKVTDRKQVQIVPYTYRVQLINEHIFKPGDKIKYTVVTKTLDGKPAPKIPVDITINDELVTTLKTGSDGTAEDTYDTSANVTYLRIEATCNECNSNMGYLSSYGIRPSQGIKLELVTQNPSFNNQVDIYATTSKPVDYFFYFATAKGVLVDYRKVYFDEDDDPDNDPTTVQFSIYPDFTYAPSTRIYAFYYDKNGAQFYHTNLNVIFKQELPNYLNLKLKGADKTGNTVVKPGTNISLTIQSKAYSVVSLAAIDQRVLQLANKQNFTLNEVIGSLNSYTVGFRNGRVFRPYSYDYYAATQSGLNFFTNIPIQRNNARSAPMSRPRASRPMERVVFSGERPEKTDRTSNVKVRKDFREVFLWEDVELDNDDNNEGEGISKISRQVTDQITTYVLYGVSMNKYYGMGLPENLPTTTIYLPFFLSLELPYSVKRNEIITLDIQQFNYLTSSQTVNLTVVNNPGFEVVNAKSNGWTVGAGLLVQIFKVPSNQVFTAKLSIKPKVIGPIVLKISAKSSSAGDSIEKVLNVIPEGVQRSITTSTLIAVDSKNPAKDQTLSCTLPASAYNDTTSVSATVVGDILGKALSNLDNLIMMPSGCGEQTMIGFVPDYAVYKYLNATNQLTAALKTKLTQYLTAGYQNELQYQRSDGSFSAFGNNDPQGSTWLSSYVAMYFYLSKSIITINSDVIQNALNFIVAQQNTDGSFKEPGRVIHSDMQGAAGNGIALTAYTTIVLSVVSNDYSSVVSARDLAVKYLEQQLDSVTDTYSLAIIANALFIANSDSATSAFNKFDALKVSDTTEIYWSVPAPNQNVYYGARSLDIEVTAYGLNLLVAKNAPLTTSLKVVKYLTGKSNSFGGYSSSQDTVMALVALSNFAISNSLSQSTVNLKLTPNFGNSFNAQVDKTNSLTLQTFSLNPNTRSLQVRVDPKSTGVAIVSLTCNFYEDPTKTKPSFLVTYNFDNSCQWRIQVQVCATPVSGNSTNMAIMEVRMPTGYYYYDAWWLNNVKSGISKTETYESNTVVIFYFDNIQGTGSCVTFAAGQTAAVAELKPGSISINDYYDTTKQGSSSFAIPSSVKNAQCNYFFRE